MENSTESRVKIPIEKFTESRVKNSVENFSNKVENFHGKFH